MESYKDDHDKVIALETMFRTMCKKIDKFMDDDVANRKELYAKLDFKSIDCSNCKVHFNGRIDGRVEKSWFMWIFGGTAFVFASFLVWFGTMTIDHSHSMVKLDTQLKQVICQLSASNTIPQVESTTGDCSSK